MLVNLVAGRIQIGQEKPDVEFSPELEIMKSIGILRSVKGGGMPDQRSEAGRSSSVPPGQLLVRGGKPELRWPGLRTSRIARVLLLLAALLPIAVHAQFDFVTNADNTITILGYTGSSGDVVVPDTTNGLPVTGIGVYAFRECAKLASVAIGTNVMVIGDYAFYTCTNLSAIAIPDSVTTVGNYAFQSCTGLTNITVGRGVTNMGYWPFSGCLSLGSITVNALNSRYRSVDGVLFDQSETTLITCPARKTGNYTVPSAVAHIGAAAFEYCSGLTNIVIPDNVVSLGISAFFDCTGLSSVRMSSNVTTIGDYAFSDCTSLTAVTIPSGVTNLGSWTFRACTSLTGVTIPGSVTSIGERVFSGCTNLSNVSMLNGVASIGVGSFEGCASLTTLNIPISVTNIGWTSFGSCGLTSISIPSSVLNIGVHAFAYCAELRAVYFESNAPNCDATAFFGDDNASIYYLPWTRGWGPTYGGAPTVVWNPLSQVHNGGFETGDFTGWTLAGNTIIPAGLCNGVVTSSSQFGFAVHAGRFGAFLGDIQLSTLSQSIPTVPGQYYLLSFWLDNLANGTQQLFSFSWISDNSTTNTLFSIVNPPAFTWTNLQFLVLASGTNATFQIQAENDPYGFGLDDVSVMPVPAPTIQGTAGSGTGLQLSWPTATGVVYQLQYKTNLLEPDWIGLASTFVATKSVATLVDTNSVDSTSQRFYRLSFRSPP
jgi:hypothetical protein